MQSSQANGAHQMNAALWGALLLLGFIWGGSFFFGRIIMAEMPALTANFFRVAPAAAMLWLVVWFSRAKPISGNNRHFIRDIALMGLLNNAIPFTLILWGQREIGSGLASIINAMTPISTLIIANMATSDEKLNINKALGAVLGVIGVGLLFADRIGEGLSGSVLAQLALLGATLSYGMAAVFGKRFAGQPVATLSASQLTASSLFILPLALVVDAPWTMAMPSQAAIGSLLGLSLLCTAIAYLLFFHILTRAGATNTSLVTLVVPPSAILLGWAFLGETLTLLQFAALLLIALGLVTIDGRVFSFRQARS